MGQAHLSRPQNSSTHGEARPSAQGGLAGLSEAEAARRLAAEGPNVLPASAPRNTLHIALEVARQPMFLLLVSAGSLYLTMGALGDALMLLGFVFVVMGITIVQERRTEHALDALRDLSSPRALVERDGQRRRIPGREVVRGDVVLLAEGDRIPADAMLRRAGNFAVDESLLTGESVPVRKLPSADQQSLDPPGGDDRSSLFSGTLVTAGQGTAEVVATGPRTVLGGIGRALQSVPSEPTPLQRETGRVVRRLAVAGLAACALVAVAYGLTRGGTWAVWKHGLLAGIAMAMALLPEEFPVILTVFLALGAWRISRSRVLTRHMPVIETLGAATVLCVDKTGTLTRNQMTLRALAGEADRIEIGSDTERLPESMAALLRAASLASKPDAFDPMERALHAAQARLLRKGDGAGHRLALVREYPLTSELPAMTHAWKDEEDPRAPLEIATKGAPESVAALCRLPEARRAQVTEQVRELAARGLRVLGVARCSLPQHELPAEQSLLRPSFLGLVAFEDPLRDNVPAAVAECRTAGIRIVMITGDYPETARSIARQAGLSESDAVITGAELEAMSEDDLAQCMRDTQIFARTVPEQKLRIVTALKRNGEIVAMTGDGVNDAPALKAAHIGIAMGARGTDVAREAASLVLLDDDFSSIVAAVRLGRRIFDNIKKAVTFVIAVHVPIAGLSVAPILLPGWPLLLLPVHIVFLELIIDPSCSLIFEAEEPEADVMRRPPRDPSESLFSRRTLSLALLQGGGVLAVCLGIVALARPNGGADAARALTFSALVAAFLTIILVNRSWTRSALGMLRVPNPALWWVVSGAGGLLALILTVPSLQRLFSFAPQPAGDLLLSLAGGIGCLLWFEVLKHRWRMGSVPGHFRVHPPPSGR